MRANLKEFLILWIAATAITLPFVNAAPVATECKNNYQAVQAIIDGQNRSQDARLGTGIREILKEQRGNLEIAGGVGIAASLSSYFVEQKLKSAMTHKMLSYYMKNEGVTAASLKASLDKLEKAETKYDQALDLFRRAVRKGDSRQEISKLMLDVDQGRMAFHEAVDSHFIQDAHALNHGMVPINWEQHAVRLGEKNLMREAEFTNLVKAVARLGSAQIGARILRYTALVPAALSIVSIPLSASRSPRELQWALAVADHPDLLLNPAAMKNSSIVQNGENPEDIACLAFVRHKDIMMTAANNYIQMMEVKFQADIRTLVHPELPQSQTKWDNSAERDSPRPDAFFSLETPNWARPAADKNLTDIHDPRINFLNDKRLIEIAPPVAPIDNLGHLPPFAPSQAETPK